MSVGEVLITCMLLSVGPQGVVHTLAQIWNLSWNNCSLCVTVHEHLILNSHACFSKWITLWAVQILNGSVMLSNSQ